MDDHSDRAPLLREWPKAGPADDRCGYPQVVSHGSTRPRGINGHDLSVYRRPILPGNRGPGWRASWYLINALIFQGAVLSLLPGRLKAAILRAFGAKVGRGFMCKPRVTIKYPWFLEVGDNVWLGEMSWIDNHCRVRIGNSVCISQGVYLFTGNHDWNDVSFRFFMGEIQVGDGAWLGAHARVGPSATVPPGTVLAAGETWRSTCG